MQILVKATTRESKQARGRTYWGVKHSDGNWYNLITDNKPSIGQSFEVDVKPSDFQGKTYRWAEVKKQAATSNNGRGASWGDWSIMMEMAHAKARDLEPDDAQARAAILNTVMIAFSNGKIDLSREEQEEVPPPDDSDIPF